MGEKLTFEPTDGRRVYYESRVREGAPEFSFDGGETWREVGVEAYRTAREAGKLRFVDAPADDPSEAAAVAARLLGALSTLRAGEEIRLRHVGNAVAVVKEKLLWSFRPSCLEEAGYAELAEAEDEGG